MSDADSRSSTKGTQKHIYFVESESEDVIFKFENASGIETPAENETILLSSAEFEDMDEAPNKLSENETEYVVQEIERTYTQMTHTEPSPPNERQFLIVTAVVEEAS